MPYSAEPPAGRLPGSPVTHAVNGCARAVDPSLDALLDGALVLLPDAAGSGLVLLSDAGAEPVACRRMAGGLDRLQLRLRQGPVVDAAARDAGAVAAVDVRNDPRWPQLGQELAVLEKPLSVICVPGVPAGDDTLVLSVYGWARSAASLGRATEQLICEVSRYVRGYAQDAAALLAARRHIEQAKGVVMALERCSAAEAFAILRRASQHYNVKLRELAVALVEVTGAAPAEPAQTWAVGPPRKVPETSDQARNAARSLWAVLNAR